MRDAYNDIGNQLYRWNAGIAVIFHAATILVPVSILVAAALLVGGATGSLWLQSFTTIGGIVVGVLGLAIFTHFDDKRYR